MNNTKPLLSVKNDVIFRLFFADERNAEDLIALLKSMLNLAEDDYHDIEIADPHLLPEYVGDKYAIIDVKLHTKSRKVIHIEIQLKVTAVLKSRIIFYDAKLITEQIDSGEKYGKIKKVISIVITDEKLIPASPRYHHRFTLYDSEAEVEFTDLLEIHTVELQKLPTSTDGTTLYDWAKFIAAETEEELDMIAQRNPQIGKAAVKLRELSADERARDLFERREKARRDIESMVDEGKAEGRAEGKAEGRAEGKAEGKYEQMIEIARKLRMRNRPLEEIMEDTGLTREEVETL